jgi:hypothetical protein
MTKPITNVTSAQNCITPQNRLYALISATYASDGTIASSVSLDFIQVRIDLARTPDVVQPQTINLPKYWAMMIDVSPIWDNSDTVYI